MKTIIFFIITFLSPIIYSKVVFSLFRSFGYSNHLIYIAKGKLTLVHSCCCLTHKCEHYHLPPYGLYRKPLYTLENQNLNSKLSHKAETESLIDTIIQASMVGSPRTQTTDQAMRKENGIELSNWEKKRRKENT